MWLRQLKNEFINTDNSRCPRSTELKTSLKPIGFAVLFGMALTEDGRILLPFKKASACLKNFAVACFI